MIIIPSLFILGFVAWLLYDTYQSKSWVFFTFFIVLIPLMVYGLLKKLELIGY